MTYKLPEPVISIAGLQTDIFTRAHVQEIADAAYGAGLSARVLEVWQVNNKVFSVLFATEAQADKFIAASSPATGIQKRRIDVLQPEPKP